VLGDFRSAPISDRDKALFTFLEKMNRASQELGAADVGAVLAAGWSEEAVYDALTVCALFSFYNKWVDAAGVSDLPADAYGASGQRLATSGYLPAGER
jgi:hypothetical protein